MNCKQRIPSCLLAVIFLTVGLVCGVCSAQPQQYADAIFSGGDIITMVEASPDAEAIAIKGGRIIAAGSKPEVMKHRGNNTRMIDLKGKALLPGFIDAHGHFSLVGFLAQSADLLSPPDGDSADFAGISDVSDSIFSVRPCSISYDLNGDCYVDLVDIDTLGGQWLGSGDPCDCPYSADVSYGDCLVNLADCATIAGDWLECGNPFDPSCQP